MCCFPACSSNTLKLSSPLIFFHILTCVFFVNYAGELPGVPQMVPGMIQNMFPFGATQVCVLQASVYAVIS